MIIFRSRVSADNSVSGKEVTKLRVRAYFKYLIKFKNTLYIYLSSSALCGNSSFKQFIKSLEKFSKLNFACGPKLVCITCDNFSFCTILVVLHKVSCAVCYISGISKHSNMYNNIFYNDMHSIDVL